MVGVAYITAILPLHLPFSEVGTSWYCFHIKADSSRFEPKILLKEDDMGIEIKQNRINDISHVEFDRHSVMKIVLKWKTSLQNSYRITQAKVDKTLTATMSEILYHANLGFSSVVGSGWIITRRYSQNATTFNSTPSSSGGAGEVWVYLDNDYKKVQLMLLIAQPMTTMKATKSMTVKQLKASTLREISALVVGLITH
ncbi:hypothetical protein FRACYDRAFT_254800 [Fragilariopsis cylindrus CCMP1102]|uniref:Uncharacterized protein n=1 Tax=Fragilariopsis cylindrus CCMP1102 TaxID=635003 RepID=A0A1E7EKF3_9STRA|nr:hypothetical protein FRACYDRAFT_254800 [Fragilariopsis cylindrus CCMP1102]|eukprot:OEU06362.1 hypothetical protein FRACYDRAFT_254800 [Fragilariopsis cylindrus CCMP1102]